MKNKIKIFLLFFLSWFLSLSFISIIYSGYIVKTDYEFAGFIYYLKTILFVIFQTLSEEILFRLVLYYLVYLIFKKILKLSAENKIFVYVVSLISGCVFILPHLKNPEVLSSSYKWVYIVSYFIVGFYFMYIMIVSKTILACFGCHFSNNAFHMLLVAPYNQSEYFKTPFLNTITEANLFYAFLNIILPIVLSYCVYLAVIKTNKIYE